MYNNIAFLIILFYSSLLNYSTEISDRYNRANYNMDKECSNENEGCNFNISYNYPISPKIPTRILSEAIIGSYKYIYLIFYIPEYQQQKSFYLEAYDASSEETIISNGDCYFINTRENNEYEIRIYKNLKNINFIRVGFLGLSKDFTMTVKIQFSLDMGLYLSDSTLDDENSSYKRNDQLLVQYIEEMNQKKASQKERQNLAKETIKSIMEKIFGTSINIGYLDKDYYSYVTIYAPPCFLFTVSYAVELDLSTEVKFHLKEIILSEIKICKGKIDTHLDGYSLLDEKIDIYNNALKLLDSYNNTIINMISKFPKDIDNYSVIISTNSNFDCIVFTIRYYSENNKTILYEIDIIIELISKNLLEKVINLAKSFGETTSPMANKVCIGINFFLLLFSIVDHVPGDELNFEEILAHLMVFKPIS